MILEKIPNGKYALYLDEIDSDLSHLIQSHFKSKEKLEDIVYVTKYGYTDDELVPDRFLVENYKEGSIVNHFMWEGLYTEDSQDARLRNMILEFFEEGKRFYCEEYEYVEEEPFYDYGDTEEMRNGKD
jgi:hypothetical protein